MRRKYLPTGTLVAYKMIPMHGGNIWNIYGPLAQSGADWSAMYAQFTATHAMLYTPNHFDRGYTSVTLVQLYTLLPVELIIVDNEEWLKNPDITSDMKANRLIELFQQEMDVTLSHPLMQSFGHMFPNSILVTFDSDQLECVIPHSLFLPTTFEIKTILTLHQHLTIPWAVRSYKDHSSMDGDGNGNDMDNVDDDMAGETSSNGTSVSRDLGQDMNALANHLQNIFQFRQAEFNVMLT